MFGRSKSKVPTPLKVKHVQHSVLANGQILCELVNYSFEVVASYSVHHEHVQLDLDSMTRAIAAAKIMLAKPED